MSAEPVKAVLLDLDDTLYPQAQWLDAAWVHVAGVGTSFGLGRDEFHRALRGVAAEGSDGGKIIDRALERIGARHVPVPPLVDALRDFEPAELVLYPRVRDALVSLAFAVPIALVTDGDPKIQRAKLRALRLGGIFDAVVISDELGRSLRKPHPAPLIHAARRLRVEPASCVYIGDRPAKDVVAAHAARMRAIRVRTGEYRWSPDVPVPWATARDLSSAIDRIRPLLANRSAALPERACR